MRAVIARHGQLVVDELPEPLPRPGEVLVSSRGTGVCGSDLRILAGQQQDPDHATDIVLGHEFCVEVLEYGPRTPETVPVGALACRNPFIATGATFEVVGVHAERPGAMAERFLLPSTELLAVPAHVEPLRAVLTEPLAVGLHAVDSALERASGGPFLVLGCGPIGLAVVIALRHRGVGPIVASGHRASRRAMAATLGADIVVDPDETSPFDVWRAHGAEPLPIPPLSRTPRPPAPVIFDCTGAPGMLQQIIAGAVSGTLLSVVGAAAEPDPIVPVMATAKSLSIQFEFAYTPTDFRGALSLVASSQIDLRPLVTSVLDFEHADEMAVRTRGESEVKVVIVP